MNIAAAPSSLSHASSCRCLLLLWALALCASGDDESTAIPPGSRILFQGDSITDGNRGRNEDPNHILGHGYVFAIAAHYGALFPDKRFSFVNRGVSGNTVPLLAARWQADTIAIKPDILSILIGVNDRESLAEYEQAYDRLLADTVSALPRVQLFLCEPFAWTFDDPDGTRTVWGGRLQVVDRLAAKYHASVIHFQRALDAAFRRFPDKAYWI